MEKLLSAWSRRSITSFGKITVIKTLVISKITHLFTNLPDPDEKFLQDLNLLLYKFLWDGKHDKIKKIWAGEDHEAGGLKIVNIKSFLSALEIGWLKRILCDNGKITKILQKICPSIQNKIKTMWEFANVIMHKVKTPFWEDVFKHFKNIVWQMFSCYT